VNFFKSIAICLIFFPTVSFGRNLIHDDYAETNLFSVHSRGQMSYGFHSNTFHVRNASLRFNIQTNDLQFFTVIDGYKDTHNPDINYSFILNNIELSDYGFYYRFFGRIFLSLRGAAVYSLNEDSLLLLPAYYSTNNPAEFDSPTQYIQHFKNAPGIRAGYKDDHFEIGYSQGDYRHSIPSAILAKATWEQFYARAAFQYEHTNPQVFDPTDFNTMEQLSLGGLWNWNDWSFPFIAEATYDSASTLRIRLEQAAEYSGFRLALRAIIPNNQKLLFEGSIQKKLEEMVSIGLMTSSDGRTYIASSVEF
jgi:hypothetical protein